MKATWVKKGDVRKVCFEETSKTLGKGKAIKRKIKETQNNNVFEKGGDGQKAKKNGILKGKTKRKTQKENRIGRKEGF